MITAKEQMICQKRVAKEFLDLTNEPLPNVKVAFEKSDNLNWYLLIHSLNDECFTGGEYIVNIKLPPRYPFEAPDFFILTPNGRFDVKKKLCFSNSSYHQQESWSPIWTMRSIIIGFISFFMEKKSSGYGHIETTNDAKKAFAAQSVDYNAANNAVIMSLFE
jgi:ubiquitin-protein ligase